MGSFLSSEYVETQNSYKNRRPCEFPRLDENPQEEVRLMFFFGGGIHCVRNKWIGQNTLFGSLVCVSFHPGCI